MKKCTVCLIEKPATEFTISARRKDGRHSKCKICYATYMREWSRKNSDVVNKRALKYHHKNAAILNWKRKLRYEANKDAHLQKTKDWAKKNADKVSNYKINNSHRRRANKNANGVFKVTTKEIKLLRKQNCIYCQSAIRMTIDHVVPLNRGGRHSIGNLVPCCKSCNSSKRDRFIMEWKLQKLRLSNEKRVLVLGRG